MDHDSEVGNREVVEATRYVESGQKAGNVLLRVGEAAQASRAAAAVEPTGQGYGITP